MKNQKKITAYLKSGLLQSIGFARQLIEATISVGGQKFVPLFIVKGVDFKAERRFSIVEGLHDCV